MIDKPAYLKCIKGREGFFTEGWVYEVIRYEGDDAYITTDRLRYACLLSKSGAVFVAHDPNPQPAPAVSFVPSLPPVEPQPEDICDCEVCQPHVPQGRWIVLSVLIKPGADRMVMRTLIDGIKDAFGEGTQGANLQLIDTGSVQ